MRRLTIRIPQDRAPDGLALYALIRYPAGEIQVRLTAAGLKACERKDGYEIVCNPIPDIVELAQLKDALDSHYAQFWHKQLFLPYMPYARADRRFVPGDSFGLGVWAKLLNALAFTSVWTFDVHSPAAGVCIKSLLNFRPTDPNVDELAAVIADIGREHLALVLPDEGSSGRYDLSKCGLPVALCRKRRDAASGKLSGFEVWRQHEPAILGAQKALIVDDICDGGGTFIGLANALHAINPLLHLYLYVSHAIFSKGTTELLKRFQEIYVSDHSFQFEGIERWHQLSKPEENEQ